MQVKERTGSDPVQLQILVKKLLIIVGRMARLLEIMVSEDLEMGEEWE